MGLLSYAITLAAILVGIGALARLNHDRIAASREDEFIPFKTFGDPAKPALVLIPGLDGATAFFADVIPELTPNFHVVLFNLPLAAPPLSHAASKAETYGFPLFAKRLAAVLDEAGIKGPASVVGESFGGMVAQRFTLDFPEKVNRLVLLSSLAKPDIPAAVTFKVNYVLPILESIGYVWPFAAQTLFAVAHLPEVVESHEPRWAKHMFVKEASWADHYSVMARVKVALDFDTRQELKNIKTGALVMFGKDDSFTATGVKQLLDGIPDAREHGLPGGHLCHMTNPKTFSRVVTEYITEAA